MLLPEKGGLAVSLIVIFTYSSWKVISLKRLSKKRNKEWLGWERGWRLDGGEQQEKRSNYDWPLPNNKDPEDTQGYSRALSNFHATRVFWKIAAKHFTTRAAINGKCKGKGRTGTRSCAFPSNANIQIWVNTGRVTVKRDRMSPANRGYHHAGGTSLITKSQILLHWEDITPKPVVAPAGWLRRGPPHTAAWVGTS